VADCSSYSDRLVSGSWTFNQLVSVNLDPDGVPRMIAQPGGGAVAHIRVPVRVALSQRASPNTTVSPDDAAGPTYQGFTGTLNVGLIQDTGSLGGGCSIGNEMVGKVTPSKYTGNIMLHRWKTIRSSYQNQTLTANVTNQDDTSDTSLEDNDPQSCSNGVCSQGTVYDLDAPGTGVYPDGLIHRYRANFIEWASLPNGKIISPYYFFYVRLSCQYTTSGYQFVNDILFDNMIGSGTTFTSWNLGNY